MDFFGYILGQPYPPPLDYPDFYTDSLKPISYSKLNEYIKIQLSTCGYPDFLISIINADIITLNKKNIEELYAILINNLKVKGFNVEQPINIGLGVQQYFSKNKYEGNIFFNHNSNADGEYFLHFFVKDTTLPSKGLFS